MSTIPSTTDDLFQKVLRFSDDIHVAFDNENAETFTALSALSDAVRKESDSWAGKIPYHINLLDFWGPREPDHSRILHHILQYKTQDGRFEWFESLICFIQEREKKFLEITVGKPHMTVEKERIDVCIQEHGKYAIIFENKSNWAGDRQNQLVRYIKKMKRHGYQEDQIYVLYLPPYSFKEPEQHSWIDTEDPDNPEADFKPRFENRYVNLSFHKGILPWLKEKVLPNIRNKDAYLLSAITQYVDYWDGCFGQRAGNKEKDMSIENIVREKLGISSHKGVLNAQTSQDLNKITEKAKEFGLILSVMNNIKDEILANIKQHRKNATLCFIQSLTIELQHEGFSVCIRDGNLKSPVNIYYDADKIGGWEVFQIQVDEIPFPFAFHLGNYWRAKGMVANYYYGFKNMQFAKAEIPSIIVMKELINGENSDYWCHYQTSIEYAENFYYMEWQGFEFWADENKCREFAHGLAQEIRDYIDRFRQIYLLTGSQALPTTEQQL